MKKYYFLFLVIGLLVISCAPNRSNPVNSAYHDLTAHYNANWIANEHIKAIEQSLFDGYEWNYNKILPIYVPFDSTDAVGLKEQTEDCIKKASISIQRHPGSKWEHPSYILVGKARFYGLEFADAVEAFKYVNTKSESALVRHEALCNLMRTFTVNKEYENASAVADFLEKEELSPRNQQLSAMNQAFLYQEQDDLDRMVQNLVKAEELQIVSKDRARIQFIIGQVYQKLGFDASAFYYYEKSLKSNPSYELSFYTKLNMAQVTELSEGKDVKTIRKYFKKLLVDRKNFEYNDKIYYEMGLFELKNANLTGAIDHFKTSVSVSQGNNRQKGLSYLSLAEVHYDSLKDYVKAKDYYDSTVSSLPKDEDNYAQIQERQEILTDFVKHITTIRLNDSLIALSRLPQDSLQSWAQGLVSQDSIKEANIKAEKDRIARSQQQRANQVDANENELISTSTGDGNWYFDNPTSVSRGYTKFQRDWNNRGLEDHWRRSNKIANAITENEQEPETETLSASIEAPKQQTKSKSSGDKVTDILARIPQTENERDKMGVEIADALYAVGNIYNFRLLEKQNAITTFNDLLSRFPGSDYEPEVLYQLYLLQKELAPTASDASAKRLVNEYPETIYAKLIVNPNFREESFAATIQLQQTYKSAFELYEKKSFDQSIQLLDSALAVHPDNEFSDNLALLRIMNIGQLSGQHKYQFELDNFLKSFPDSELIAYAKDLIVRSEDHKLNLYSSSKGQYQRSFDQTHYFIVVYKSTEENSTLATKLVNDYMKRVDKELKFGNLLLSEDFSMVVISDLSDKSEAMSLHSSFSNEMNPFEIFKGQEHYLFAISEENFDQFYKTKDLESYRTFFDKNYL